MPLERGIMPEIYFRIKTWFEGTYTLRILDGAGDLLLKIGPYLLVSICISVVVTRLMRGRKLLFTPGSEFLAIVSAALVGLVSPLPTYAAIPMGLSLIPAGVPFAAVLAFAITSPLMNPSVFFLTVTQLGMEMAIARTVTAFFLGVAGGLLAMRMFSSFARGIAVPPGPHHQGERTLLTDLWKTTAYSGKYFSIAILISAAVKALVPPQAVMDLLGPDARVGTLVAVGLGVPFYSCGGAAIPLVQTLMELGMSKGATLAFFIAGPATKLETIYAFKAMLGGKVLLFYLALTLAFSLVAGFVYSLW
jgi:uncharacterized protein